MASIEENRPFKLVTRVNWLDPDPVSASCAQLDHRTGVITRMSGADWIDTLGQTVLSNHVPLEVRTAFDFAKGGLGVRVFLRSRGNDSWAAGSTSRRFRYR